MIINLKKEPKEVSDWVREVERATGLSGSALVVGALIDFSRKARENKQPRPAKNKNPQPKKPAA